MPELPDLVAYIDALTARILTRPVIHVNLVSPFVLRSVEPGPRELTSRAVLDILRIGKRIVLRFDDGRVSDGLFLVMHLMVAGRLRWREPGRALRVGPRILLASLEFDNGTLFFTEASSKKRASMLIVRGAGSLRDLDPGGIEPLASSLADFRFVVQRENHTVKRALTDPRLVSGIGNAYSDEILHAARLSPLTLTQSLSDIEVERLHSATIATLALWCDRLRRDAGTIFPEKVTAFRPGMSVHGRYRQPCPVCGARVQRIVYADNECNYCARCQTGGRLLADRALSRLLREDRPTRLDE
jgi:formamidopyrimidine-DNA glycosylase